MFILCNIFFRSSNLAFPRNDKNENNKSAIAYSMEKFFFVLAFGNSFLFFFSLNERSKNFPKLLRLD